MGFFDGLHRGHQRVIAAASADNALRGVLTFEQHPLTLLKPEAAPLLLTPHAAHKQMLMAAHGVDVLLTLPFTRELAATDAAEFLKALYLACPQGIRAFSVGSNWRFGKGGCGNVELLRRLAKERGTGISEQGLLSLPSGEIVCSSAIRRLLAAGDLEGAEKMLGRPFDVFGTVEHGQKLARRLGFPTANIALSPHAALPPFGVYEVTCTWQGRALRGIANLGLRPTIREATKQVRLEAHFLGFSGDLYGTVLTVSLRRFLRPERPFPDVASLTEQIRRDVAEVSR